MREVECTLSKCWWFGKSLNKFKNSSFLFPVFFHGEYDSQFLNVQPSIFFLFYQTVKHFLMTNHSLCFINLMVNGCLLLVGHSAFEEINCITLIYP